MFTRGVLPALLVLAMIAGTAFGLDRHQPDLEPYYADNEISLVAESERSAETLEILQQAEGSIGQLTASTHTAVGELDEIRTILTVLAIEAQQEARQAAEQASQVGAIVDLSGQHVRETGDVLDEVLSTKLGKPIGQTFGDKANIKVFTLQEAGLRGYMAKIKLHDPSAVRMVLSGDTVGHRGETTSEAAKRTGAELAVNAGGFARQDGLLYPMGITVVDGEIKTFYSTELSFIGINKEGQLVGGEVTSREQIAEMGVMHGATFVPTLLKDGKKETIPAKYRNKREPRTLIGHFSNGDLLLIVIDGRSKDSAGLTLEEAQDKLLEWNVRDAYNFDGGGSSTFVYQGKVLNSPSDGRERRVVSNFVVIP